MRNLQSRVYHPLPPMLVNIDPCWYSGSRREVLRKFNDFKEFITIQDAELTDKIDNIKRNGNIQESGNEIVFK